MFAGGGGKSKGKSPNAPYAIIIEVSQLSFNLCHGKMCLMIFVAVIPKEVLVGGPRQSFFAYDIDYKIDIKYTLQLRYHTLVCMQTEFSIRLYFRAYVTPLS